MIVMVIVIVMMMITMMMMEDKWAFTASKTWSVSWFIQYCFYYFNFLDFFSCENHDDVYTKGLDAADVVVPTLKMRSCRDCLEIFILETMGCPEICLTIDLKGALLKEEGHPRMWWNCDAPGVRLLFFFTSALSFVFVFCICVFEFNGTVIFLGFDWLFSFTVRTTNKQTRSQLWNIQIIYYLCMKIHKCTFFTFPHFQGWPPQDLQQAGVSTCCDGFGTKSSPKFVFNQSF